MNNTDSLNSTQSTSNALEGFSISLSAPGKVILFGEHSVVYSKPALAASLGLRTYLSLVENEYEDSHSEKFIVNLEAVKLSHCYEIQDIKNELLDDRLPPTKNPSNYTLQKPELVDHDRLLSKIERFIKNRSGSVPLQKSQYQSLVALFYLLTAILKTKNELELTPLTLTIKSDLSIGAGLGSSASFLVVLSAALIEYVKFKTRRFSVEDINEYNFYNLEFEGSKKEFPHYELELISRWAFNAEKIIHGTPSGLDNTICTFGMMVEFKKMAPIVPINLRHKLSVILVNSMVPKDTKTLVTKVAVLKDKYPVIVGSVLNAMEEVTSKALKALMRLDEVVTESRMPLDKCDAEILETYTILEDLADINQNLLRSLGVSHMSLDEICSILAEKNLHGKLTGAGGGGYAFAFIPPGYRAEDLNYVVSKLTSRHYDAKVADLGGPGIAYL